MPQNMSDPEEDDDNMFDNMVSNLPLLFAAGYPTSLDKITELQLEKFIPFLVQCSLGNIQIQQNAEYSEPEWWPETVPFSIPLRRPSAIHPDDWHRTMREIVTICYSFHKGIFLLRFCNELCTYQPEQMRFIDNQNSTTSLFDRVSNKLLVTFRNENMLYDAVRLVNSKKTLMPRLQSSALSNQDNDGGAIQQNAMVETVLFDIYLCDNCEAELYSKEAYDDHEKHCILDDDVICCDPLDEPKIPDTIFQQSMFLYNFGLQTDRVPLPSPATLSKSPTKHPKDPPGKLRRMPKRGRAVMAVGKCPTIPLASPAGQMLLKLSNSSVTPQYTRERLDRIERFGSAPCLVPTAQNRPKFMDRRQNTTNISTTFRRPALYHCREYKFPRRQFSRKRRDEAFLHFNFHFLRKCYPLTVQLTKMSQEKINSMASKNKEQTSQRRLKPNRRKSQLMSVVQDVIDLCSSDEEQSTEQNERNVASSSNQPLVFEQVALQSPETSFSCIRSTTSMLNDSGHISIHPIHSSDLQTDFRTSNIVSSSNSRSESPTSPQSPSVFLISHLTKTSMTLANHKKTYRYRNQENSHRSVSCINLSPSSIGSPCSSIELALPNSVTLTAASHHNNNNDNNKCLPDVVIERILQPNQQMCIDLT